MSIISNRAVQNGLVNFIKKFSPDYGVGYLGLDIGISSMPASSGVQPSVLRDRIGGTRPDYPFIIVDQVDTARERDSWIRDIIVEDDKPVYVIERQLHYTVTCYGDDSLDVMNLFQMYIVEDSLRYLMNTEIQGTFQGSSDIKEQPAYLETGFMNSASMTMTFSTVSSWSLPTGSIIETVEVDGLLNKVDNDLTPTPIQVIETSI